MSAKEPMGAVDPAERAALRREILDDVGTLLRDELAADTWGRVLVEVLRAQDGTPVVAGIDVEEILADEERVDAVFRSDRARELLPILAKAVEALCAIEDVDLDEVRGGTFVRRPDDGFAWLPALVNAPSVRFDRERDALVAAMRAKNDALRDRYDFPGGGRLTVDLAAGTFDFVHVGGPGLRGQATLLGTFAPVSRTWGWGGTNPHAPPAVKAAAARVIDEVLDRDLWELSTPVFATDEQTAWALAAFVCDRAKGDAVLCSPEGEGLVFMLVRGIVETSPLGG